MVAVVLDLEAPLSRTMTRCECAEVAFADVARAMREQGLPLCEATRRSGCGQLCSACLPDLHRYLRSR